MSEEYSKIEVNLDDDTKIALVSLFVKSRLDEVSQITYLDALDNGEVVEDALFNAILNEMILEAMIHQFENQTDTIDIIEGVDGGC